MSSLIPYLGWCTFCNPGKFVFGIDSALEISSEVELLTHKNAKIFLLVDEELKKVDAYKKVRELLEEKHNPEIFSKKFREPDLKIANETVDEVRKDDFELVVGIGGGSTMDIAKTAAIMHTNPGEVKNYFHFERSPIMKKPLPLILIPTTAGTGSEATPYAMIVDERNVKNAITSPEALPDVAIVDPRMTVSCPPRITASAGMDALEHSLEAVLSLKATPVSDMYAFKGIELAGKNLRTAYFWGDNLVARYNMSIAATLGGIAISTPAMINVGHALSEYLGPKYNIPHGIINAIVAPFMMEFNLPAAKDRLYQIASCLDVNTSGLSVREKAEEAIRWVRRLTVDLELPLSLKEMKVPEGDIEKIATYLVEKQQFEYGLPERNPRRLTMENVMPWIENMWKGELKVG